MGKTYTMRNGFTVEYAQLGDPQGYPVLYLHGLLGSFPVNMGAYTGPLRILELKRSGYGKSSLMRLRSVIDYARNIQEFIEYLQLDEFGVLAHSAGAPFALAMGAAYPRQVKAIAITSGVPECYKREVADASPAPLQVRFFYALCRNLPLALTALALRGFVKKHVRRYGAALRELYPGDMLDTLIQDALVNGGKGMAETALTQGRPWGFAMREVAPKVLWSHSRKDEEVAFLCAEATWRLIPDLCLRAYETESHSAPVMFFDLLHALNAECETKDAAGQCSGQLFPA